MAKKWVEEVIRQQMPGHRVVSESQAADESDSVGAVDAASHSLDELKRKYVAANSGLDEAVHAALAHPATAHPATAQPATTRSDPNDDVEIVAVVPQTDEDEVNSPPTRAKAAVVSRKSGVIGEQG